MNEIELADIEKYLNINITLARCREGHHKVKLSFNPYSLNYRITHSIGEAENATLRLTSAEAVLKYNELVKMIEVES